MASASKGGRRTPTTPRPSPIAVHVYIDGVGVAAITATIDRPDLGPVIAERSHGYSHWFSVPAGRHTVCTYGINTSSTPGGNALLGCRSAEVTNSPIGSLDLATDTPAPTLSGAAPSHLAGWAIDPNSAAPAQIDVYVDGAFTQSVEADGLRTDVGDAFPSFGDRRGFDLPLVVPNGSHEVCVYALNRPDTPGDDALLGCRSLQSQANRPFGVIDELRVNLTGVYVSGWGIDPYSAVWTGTAGHDAATQGLGPLETFRIRVDGAPAVLLPADGVEGDGEVRSTIDRLDVVAATPPADPMFRLNGGPRYGFAVNVYLTAGWHSVCVIVEHHPHVRTAATAAPDTTLGCATVEWRKQLPHAAAPTDPPPPRPPVAP